MAYYNDCNRRRFLLGGASGLASAAFPFKTAHSQSAYPNRPVTFICPWPIGGSADMTMRVLTQVLSQQIGQPIIFKNIAGASGMMGAHIIATAKPDGYTIGQIPTSVVRFAELGMVTFDPLKDFTYLARTSGQTFGIVVPADSPYRTLAGLITAARANPDKLSYASAGVGSASHVGMEEFLLAAGIKMQHVPYKGGAPALADLLNGQVDAAIDSSSWADQVKEGKLILLATLGEARLPSFSKVPVLKEFGYNVMVNAPNGIGAPAGLNLEVQNTLRKALRKAILSPEFKTACYRIQVPILYQDAEDFHKYMLSQHAYQKQLIEKLNLKAQLKGS